MQDDIQLLLRAWLNDEVDAEGAQQALQRLRDDESFRQAFVDEMSMLGMIKAVQTDEPHWEKLELALGDDALEDRVMSAIETGTKVATETSWHQQRRGKWWRALGIVASIAAIVLFVLLQFPSGEQQPHQQDAGTGLATTRPGSRDSLVQLQDDGVAVLVHAVDVDWRMDDPPTLGAILSPGPLKMQGGLVQIEFYSGARLIVEGDADLSIVSANEAVCRKGRLRAIVPQHARGFRISSPKFDLVDLGTEFGLQIGDDGLANVQVFDGEVELYRADTDQSESSVINDKQVNGKPADHLLTEGEAITWTAGGKVQRAEADPSQFTSFQQARDRSLAAENESFEAWESWNASIEKDPRILARYSFQSRSDMLLKSNHPTADGTIVGCERVSGRWKQKRALDFKRPGDRVRIEIPGQFKSMTLSAWIRVDALPGRDQTLLLTDPGRQHRLHWQINPAGGLYLGIRMPSPVASGEAASRFEWVGRKSPIVFTTKQLGQWHFVTTVCDGDEKRVQHFINGTPVSSHSLDDDRPLEIGLAEIGNFGKPVAQRGVVRNFVGRIDEMTIWKTALDPTTITDLYERGKQ